MAETPAPQRAVVLLSGGLDSAVLLALLRFEGWETLALSCDYGQRHRRELDSARALAAHYGLRHETADLRALAHLLSSSLTDTSVAVPHGHYTAENMKSTVVPNRNMILAAVAAGWAISQKASAVAYAAHSGDHTIYPDCREEFAQAVDQALRLCDWSEVRLLRPFTGKSKADLVRLGTSLGVPFHLTWSCYEGGDKHCGQCGTCVERIEAFKLAGVSDPTVYSPLP